MNKKIVLCGPSASGKNHFRDWLRDNKDMTVDVSFTTRPRRPCETEGDEYWFIDRDLFEHLDENGFFLESVEFKGNKYGTSIKSAQESDVFIMTPEGLSQLEKKYPTCSIYLAPSEAMMRVGMAKRGDKDTIEIERRIKADQEAFAGFENHNVKIEFDGSHPTPELIYGTMMLKPKRNSMKAVLLIIILHPLWLQAQTYALPTGMSYTYNEIYIPPDTLGIGKPGRLKNDSGTITITSNEVTFYKSNQTYSFKVDSVFKYDRETYYMYWATAYDSRRDSYIGYAEAVWFEEMEGSTSVGRSALHMTPEKVSIVLGTIRYYNKYIP